MGVWGRIWPRRRLVPGGDSDHPNSDGRGDGLDDAQLLCCGRMRDLHSTGLPAYSQVVVWLFYGAVAWGSIGVGRPFSLQYARESALPRGLGESGFLAGEPADKRGLGAGLSGQSRPADSSLNPRRNSLWIAVVIPILSMVAASIFTTRVTRRWSAPGTSNIPTTKLRGCISRTLSGSLPTSTSGQRSKETSPFEQPSPQSI